MSLQCIFAVFFGSGLGGVCRYMIGRMIQNHFTALSFPLGTFAVNVAGCFLIGLFYGLFDRYASSSLFLSPQLRLFLTVGFCGGFTTFSTFINENFQLFQSQHLPAFVCYITLSIIFGFLLLYAGYFLSRQ